MKSTRRDALKTMGTGLAAYGLFGGSALFSACGNGSAEQAAQVATEAAAEVVKEPFFKISLAQWSLHKSFFGDALSKGFGPFVQALQTDPDSILQGELDPLNFPIIAKQQFGIDAIEFVNTFYFSKAKNMEYLKDLKGRCDGEGVKPLLIMCDAEGNLGDLDAEARKQAVLNHFKWVDAAKFLGCHSIRVNAAGNGTAEEVAAAAVEGLGTLTEYGQQNGINIIVENHGGYSSNGKWLAGVISQVNSDFCGTLPDFGNFCIKRGADGCEEEYDRYVGLKELMPYAKGVSGKSNSFDEEGNETGTDFYKAMQIVKDSGFTGYVDIEYEGSDLSEADGIIATKKLLEKVGEKLS